MTGAAGHGAPSLSLVVPLYNEEERIAEFGPQLADFIAGFAPGSELILVDDGSTDGTIAATEALLASRPEVDARLLRRAHAGKGAAVRSGLAEARGDVAAFCDVDLATPLDQLERVVRAAAMSQVLAIGSRDTVASHLIKPEGRVRELLGKAYNRLVQLTVAPGVTDTQCGAKAAATVVWKDILRWCNEEGFAWDVEAVAVARRLGFVVREVAVDWRHDDRSKVRVVRDGARMLAAIPRISGTLRSMPRTAPARSGPSGVFDPAQAATLIESDSQHWWFRCKAAFVSAAIRAHLRPGEEEGRLVDVGGGAGGVTTLLGWPPDRLYSVDGSELLCREAGDRHALMAVVGVGERLPFADGSVAVVALLDVIEHLEDPAPALAEARRILADDGLLVVNVPAHQWLWSGADELLGHVRRYTRPMLRRELVSSGFRPDWMSHVFSWLVAPVWLRRHLTRSPEAQLGLDDDAPLIGRAALVLSAIERAVVRRVSLPLGTSVLCVARPDRSRRPDGPGGLRGRGNERR